ncbi:MAG TPA: gliding motility-associated C-terminal domain-containing protein [Flavobacteriales bacterium]|nr:gliding motility-associated C-terminal domain-containing protein [Flavobacteriales bacterium]
MYNKTIRIGILLFAGCTAGLIRAQPICSINIGADRTICQGQSTVLQGPAGYSNYLWSTGATTPDITVGTAGDYWCQVSYPSGQLVTNGDFSAGNTGFTSQFTYSLVSVQNEGMYTVGPNASWYHNQFQGTGTGNFLIANAGYVSWLNGQHDVWCQTVPCCPGQTYTLSFWGRTLSNATPARVAWHMNGVIAHWPDFTFPAFNAGWQQYTTTWTAGPGQTSVQACIRVTSGDGVGDDFGIDDISISGMVYLRDTLHVSVTPLPSVNLGPDATLCAGQSMDLDVTVPGGYYLWQDGSTSPAYHVTQAGTYEVQVTAQNCTATDQITVGYNPIPSVDLGPDQVVCPGDAATFDATMAGATYLWNTGWTGPTYTTTQPGAYTVAVTAGGCTGQGTATLSNFTLHTVDLGPDQSFCMGSNIRIGTQVNGASYMWDTGATTDSITVTTPGIHWLDVTLNGCTVRDSILITQLPLPVVALGPAPLICPGGTALLDATTPGATYLWSNGATTPTIQAGAGTWTVNATVNGCTGTATVAVGEYPPPTVDLGPDVVLCPGDSWVLDATQAGATYLWNTGHTGPTITVSAATTAIVTVTDDNGCTASDTAVVTYMSPGAVSLGPDLSICPGDFVRIGAHMPGASYVWNTGATTDSISVQVAGTYWVNVLVNGCTVSDTIVIATSTAPTVSLGPGQQVCPGTTATLDASTPGATYLWSNGATTPTINVGPGTWSVDVTLNGCTATASATIAEYLLPQVGLGPDIALCPNDVLTLNATLAGASHVWSTGETAPTIQVAQAGTVWVTVTDQHGCSVSDTIVISHVNPGQVQLGPDLTLCAGDQATLDATMPGAANYTWSNGSTNPTLITGTPGTYWVSVETGTCHVTDTITISTTPAINLSIGSDTTLCPGATLLLQAVPANLSMVWQDGSQGTSFLVSATGQYHAVATDGFGCSDSASVDVNYLDAFAFSLGPDTTICNGTSLTLHAGVPNGTTQWSGASSATTPSIFVSTTGTYIATTSVAGCSFSDTVQVVVSGPPVPDLGPDTVLCEGSSITLSVPGGTVLWDNGSTGNNRTITQGGTYWVQTLLDGCTAADTLVVTTQPLPAVNLGTDTVLCPGHTLTLQIPLAGATVLWENGSTSNPRMVAAAGTYTATVTVGACSAQDHITVGYTAMPAIDLGGDRTACIGDTVVLAVDPGNAQTLWSNGSNASAINVGSTGTYGVLLTMDGCSTAGSVHITFIPVATSVGLGPDTGICPGVPMTLDATIQGGSYLWNDGSTGATLVTTMPGIYSVTVTGPCILASDTIRLFEGDCDPMVHVPNAFTPDGDGINDVFRPLLDGTVRQWTFLIFNRWGERIFSSESPDDAWDGRYKGQEAPQGVYTWHLHYESAPGLIVVQVRRTGSVTLLR